MTDLLGRSEIKQAICQTLNQARCHEKGSVGNIELTERIVQAINDAIKVLEPDLPSEKYLTELIQRTRKSNQQSKEDAAPKLNIEHITALIALTQALKAVGPPLTISRQQYDEYAKQYADLETSEELIPKGLVIFKGTICNTAPEDTIEHIVARFKDFASAKDLSSRVYLFRHFRIYKSYTPQLCQIFFKFVALHVEPNETVVGQNVI